MLQRLVPLLLALTVVVVACGDDGTGDDGADGTRAPTTGVPIASAEYDTYRSLPVACGSDAPEPARRMTFTEPEDLELSQPVTAILHTSCGEITLELDPSVAPATVNSFVFLAEQGYFDGTVSHRVAPGFVIQAGDPTATGRGGPGYSLPDELPPPGFIYERGVIAMANAGAGTGGSQFFLMLADSALPPLYSVFGQVVDGLAVMDRIAEVPRTTRAGSVEQSVPLEGVYVERVEIVR